MVQPQWVTTGLGFEGCGIARHLGVVRGITVRSRSIVGNIGASLQTLVGGNITLYTELCETARQEAFDGSVRSNPLSAHARVAPLAMQTCAQ